MWHLSLLAEAIPSTLHSRSLFRRPGKQPKHEGLLPNAMRSNIYPLTSSSIKVHLHQRSNWVDVLCVLRQHWPLGCVIVSADINRGGRSPFPLHVLGPSYVVIT